MHPVRVAAIQAFMWRPFGCGIAFEPSIDIVMVKLFAPEQPGKRLSLHPARVVRYMTRSQSVIELVGFLKAVGEDTIEVFFRETVVPCLVGKPQTNGLCLAGRKREHILGRGFGPHVVGIDCLLLTLHDIMVKAILHVSDTVLVAVKTALIVFICCEEKRWLTLTQ